MAPQSMQPIIVYGAKLGPNPLKVRMILAELDIPYEDVLIPMSDVKKPPYLALNPNGRVPTIKDPNTGITLWETGAIIPYLIANYDPDHKLSFPANSPEDWHTKQWLAFQISGQGPYYGQGMIFTLYAPETIPFAQQRYANEAKRVTGVLEHALTGREWLVGDKCTYADIAFISWQNSMPVFVKDINIAKEFPNVEAWMNRMRAKPAIKVLLAEYMVIRSEMLAAAANAAGDAKKQDQ